MVERLGIQQRLFPDHGSFPRPIELRLGANKQTVCDQRNERRSAVVDCRCEIASGVDLLKKPLPRSVNGLSDGSQVQNGNAGAKISRAHHHLLWVPS